MPKKLKQALVALGLLLGTGVVLLVGFVLFVLPHMDIAGARDSTPYEFIKEMARAKKTLGGVEYTVNNSTASFRLDIDKPNDHGGRLFRDYASALAYCREHGLKGIPSVQLVQGKLKQFDDGLVAALELAVERGLPEEGVTGKREALSTLAERLVAMRAEADTSSRPHVEKALVHVLTALALGGDAPAMPADVAPKVEAAKAEFLTRPDLSKPIGFWTWSDELGRVFTQDRFLSQGLALPDDMGAVVAISLAISHDPEIAETFTRLRDFGARLTNPPTWIDTGDILAPERACVPFEEVAALVPERASVNDALAPEMLARVSAELAKRFGERSGFALVAYSESKEYDLLRRAALSGEGARMAGKMEVIIEAVRSGRLSLEPRPGAGWYDYQQHALETLILPERGRESAKLDLTDAYRERLKNAFATILTKQRETHIKRLPHLMEGLSLEPDEPPPVVEIGPEFSVEPTVTVYLRLARGYRFLATALAAVLGEDALSGLRRMNEDGSVSNTPLDQELRESALRLYGLYEMLSVEVGQRPEYLKDEITPDEIAEARDQAARWLESLTKDTDLARDTRVAVPIALMDIAGPTRFWGTAGVRLERVIYKYKDEPRVEGRVEPVFVPTRYYLATDVFAEFERPGTASLTRDEWRALCDSYADAPSLLAGLNALNRPAPRGFPYGALATGLILVALIGGAAIAGWRYRERLRAVEWRRVARRVYRAILNKRLLKWTGAALGSLLVIWILALVIFPRYRVRFLVKYVARINTPLGLFCEMRFVPDVPAGPRTEALVELMSHPDAQVRYLAARFIGVAGYSDSDEERAKALAVLRREDVQARLREAADSPEPEVAVGAVWALRDTADARNTEFLLAKLRQAGSSDMMRLALVMALDPKALGALLPLTYSPSRRLRRRAAYVLGNFDDERAARRLMELVRSPDVEMSDDAASAVGSLRERFPGNPWAREFDMALVALVGEPSRSAQDRGWRADDIADPALKMQACLAMIRSPTPKEEPWCFDYALRELEELGATAREAVPEIEKLLDHPDERVRDAAKRALEKIRGED